MRKIFVLLPFILSMAEPVKDRRLKVEVEDNKGLKHNLSGLVCSGKPSLKVREGMVDYSIEFTSLKRIEVLGTEGQELRVRLTLKDGASREYALASNIYCKASSTTGEAGFYLRDVRNIFIRMEERAP